MIINELKNKLFPLYSGNYYEEFKEESSESKNENISPRGATDKSDKYDESNFTADDLYKMYIGNADDLDKLFLDTEKYLDPNLIKNYFFERSLKIMSDFLKHKKDTPYGKIEVALIKNNLKDLKTDIKYKPENEVKNKRLELLAGLVEKILDFNELLNIPDLKSEKSTKERQQGQRLKILTPQQMITRLPILLAQLKSGNNSQKLKNEIRQIVHSSYRSKNISKTIYNQLINNI